jgi:ATP-dependent helicase Lhr and Lhr-like helicase
MGAEDLIGAVFPDQIACAENLPGEREIPDHPLVDQTIADCLNEAMDIAALERLLGRIEAGDIRIVTRDLTQPSPLALEVLTARPYAYLDDAPLEERRTQAVMSRRWLSPEIASDIGRLDDEAIARVRSEAWPDAANADELHDALVWLGFLTEAEAQRESGWNDWLTELAGQKRAARLDAGETTLWISAERLPHFRALWPRAKLEPAISAPAASCHECSRDDALVEILRGRLEGLGPVTQDALAAPLHLAQSDIAGALAALEAEGFAMRGRFTAAPEAEEWCERRLLARIHGYTVKRLRAEIEPVAARDFLRFLLGWQRVAPGVRMQGPNAVDAVVGQLEGFEAPAGAWEGEILSARITGYEPHWLDDRCLAGHIAWTRLRPRPERANRGRSDNTNGNGGWAAPLRTTPIVLLARRRAALWASLSTAADPAKSSPRAQAVADCFRQHGASFFDELMHGTGLLRSQLEEALAELVALGLATSDSFGGLRALLVPSSERRPIAIGRRRRRTASFGMEGAGRWALIRAPRPAASDPVSVMAAGQEAIEHVAHALLRRYGVVFWRLLEREAAWLPPWRDLLRVYRRLESRGEIRGGRFVAGFSGEQFALPDAVAMLREVRRQPDAGSLVSVSGADPLNLVGILTPGPRLPALTGNRVLYRDGVPIALLAAGAVQFLESLEPQDEWQAHKALLRGAMPAPPISPDEDASVPTASSR